MTHNYILTYNTQIVYNTGELLTNTVVNPGAMMIKLGYTLVADGAVLGPKGVSRK